MFADYEYIKQFTDVISEGLIFIDKEGIIQIYNKRSKEIFGVIYDQGKGHALGCISKGDIVIIADNSIGRDDGGLSPQDLSAIGIKGEEAKLGDAVVAVGVYMDGDIKPVYKIADVYMDHELLLETNYLNNKIKASIDFGRKVMDITVNEEVFKIEYIKALGHIVILSGKTGQIKFYQAKGYTIRKESINDILSGKQYIGKGTKDNIINVIGRDIFDVHGFLPDIKEFLEVAQGKDLSYRDKFIEINGRPTLCTLTPINKENERIGALLKVKDISELKELIKERDKAIVKMEKMESELMKLEESSNSFPNIVGESPEILGVKSLLNKATKSFSTVLLLGESGTGKGLMAKEIHEQSKLRDKPFIHVNCTSIPETLLESELFGYEGGAFTGAKAKGKIGIFEMANDGTIFLDEIAEIPLSMQAKLLQVLQSKTFYRVGGTKEISVNIRIIAATNKNLEEEVLKGRFREDLFYRINVFPIWIPPLRERKQDIYSLVHSALPNICKRVGCEDKHISGEAIRMLTHYEWPGNVRQLENVLERAVNLCEGNTILSKHLHIEKNITENIKVSEDEILPLNDVVKEAEKEALTKAIDHFEGDRKKVMKALKIGKTSFYDKLKKYKI